MAPGDTVTLVNITSTLMDFNTAHLPMSVGNGTATLLSTESGGSAYSAASAGAGGAIYLDGGVTFLQNNTFNSNIAGTYGGALAYKQERYLGMSSTGQLIALHTQVLPYAAHAGLCWLAMNNGQGSAQDLDRPICHIDSQETAKPLLQLMYTCAV